MKYPLLIALGVAGLISGCSTDRYPNMDSGAVPPPPGTQYRMAPKRMTTSDATTSGSNVSTTTTTTSGMPMQTGANASMDTSNAPAMSTMPSAPTQQQRSVAAVRSGPAVVNNRIDMSSDYQQSWNRVGRAVSKSGYQVMEQDRSLGTYYIVDKSGTGGKIQKNAPIYQVRVQRNGDTTSVSVLNAKNQPADRATTARVLNRIQGQL